MDYSEKLKSPKWQKRRLEVMQRDAFTCQCCGDTETTLNVHHIKYTGEPWDAPNENLITVCKDCHLTIENLKLDCRSVSIYKRNTVDKKMMVVSDLASGSFMIVSIRPFFSLDLIIHEEAMKGLVHFAINQWLKEDKSYLLNNKRLA